MEPVGIVHCEASPAPRLVRRLLGELVAVRFHPSRERIVWTFESEDFPGHVCLETITFGERGDMTVVRQNTVYQSVEDRDAAVASGMEEGIDESMERLDELLGRLVPVN